MLACAALASFPNRESRTKTFSAEMVADILLDRPPHRNPAPLHPPITYLLLSFFFNSDSFCTTTLPTNRLSARAPNKFAREASERANLKKDFFISRFLFFFRPRREPVLRLTIVTLDSLCTAALDSRPLPSKGNLVPRVLSLPRESTLVTAGHVSARF